MPLRDPKWRLLVIAAIAGSRAATIDITFPPELEQRPREIGTLVFKASKGDIVRWRFTDADKAQNHSVIQVSFDNPCTPLPGGFASPIGALNTNSEFSVTIDDDSSPIYWSCASTSSDPTHDHCQEGEVGVISALDISQADKDQLHITAHASAHTGALGRVAATPLGSGAGGVRVVNTSASDIPVDSSSSDSGTRTASLPPSNGPTSSLQTVSQSSESPGPSSGTTATTKGGISPAIYAVPAILGAAALAAFVYLAVFIRRRRRRARESVTPLSPTSTAQPSSLVSQRPSGGWADDSSQAPTGGTSPLTTKAKALGMFRESTAWTDASTPSRGLTSTEDARSDADGSQWQAVQQAARGAGFSPQALLASLNRVQHPGHPHGGDGGETMPPRYDG